MKTFIALLRGVNVSGQKKMPMASLRELCGTLGFHEVQTYIQSGNIVFKSNTKDHSVLEHQLREGIMMKFGFDVPVTIKTLEQLENAISRNPYGDKTDVEANKIYFVFLSQTPNEKLVRVLKDESFLNETFELIQNCIYLKCNKGYGKAKLNNNLIERKLKVEATTRNFRTMNTLLVIAKAYS